MLPQGKEASGAVSSPFPTAHVGILAACVKTRPYRGLPGHHFSTMVCVPEQPQPCAVRWCICVLGVFSDDGLKRVLFGGFFFYCTFLQ